MKTISYFKFILLLPILTAVPALAQPTLTTLYSFNGTAGSKPRCGLIQGTNGNFYGMTFQGGTNGVGSIYQMTPGGTVSDVLDFLGFSNGAEPSAPFIKGRDGKLYGEALSGTFGQGTVFQLDYANHFTNIYMFEPPAGNSPEGPLLQGRDGSFYGVTEDSAVGGFLGTVYRLSADGSTITNLYSFTGNDGNRPESGLVQGPDGMLYGTTLQGGTNGGFGTIFKITTNGGFQSLWSFNKTNGSTPENVPLVFGPDGALYGTTDAGGTNVFNAGTIFRITTNGTFTSLVSLDGDEQGGQVNAGLLLASDGNFYGLTSGGNGTIFRVTTNGTFTTVYAFDGTQGFAPLGTLIQGTDGNLYGVTQFGGDNNLGTIFKLNLTGGGPAAPLIVSVGLTNGTLGLAWSSLVNSNYQVQYNAELATTNWTNLNAAVTATGTNTSATDTVGTNLQRFYRVLLVP